MKKIFTLMLSIIIGTMPAFAGIIPGAYGVTDVQAAATKYVVSERFYIDYSNNRIYGAIGLSKSEVSKYLTNASSVKKSSFSDDIIKDNSTYTTDTSTISIFNTKTTYTFVSGSYVSAVAVQTDLSDYTRYTNISLDICPGYDTRPTLYAASYSGDRLESLIYDTGDYGLCTLSLDIDCPDDEHMQLRLFLWDEELTPIPGMDKSELAIGPQSIGDSVMLNEDFESGSVNVTTQPKGHKIEVTAEDDGNRTLLMEKVLYDANYKDFFIDAKNLGTSSDFAVYEFDLKIAENDTMFNMTFDDTSGAWAILASLNKDGNMCFTDGSVEFEMDRWYRFSFVFNYFDRVIEYYADGTKIDESPIPAGFAENNATVSAIRWHVRIDTQFGGKGSIDDEAKLYLDNIRAYDSRTPLGNPGEVQKEIIPSDKSPFADDSAYIDMLEGCSAFHNRSGVLYSNGEKHLLTNDIRTEDGVTVVNTAKFCAALGTAVPQSADEYMTAEDIFISLGKKVTAVDSEINSGLIVAGSSAFMPPNDASELQELNDYVFYLRPSEENVTELYKSSPNYGKHPRIQSNAADFARIREEIKTDTYMSAWADAIIREANTMLYASVVEFELRDGVRLLGVSREVLNKMYVLGMAYQLTGDNKYPARAYRELEAVCGFDSWHPSHALDVGEMAAAVAIGYDWMYDAFSPEQRSVIEHGIYNNCFYDYYILYTEPQNGYMSELGIQDGNWVCPISGGGAMAALAMMDVYPDVAPFILKSAIRALDGMTFRYAPDGAWYEGPHYWEYVMQYSVKMFTSLKTGLGTDLGFSKCEGLSRAGRYILEMQGDLGIFNFGDGHRASIYCPELFWMSNEYNDPAIAQTLISKTDGKMANGSDRQLGEYRALALIFYDAGNTQSGEVFNLDALYERDGVAVMRNSWDSENTTFTGIHFGDNRAGHAHLDTGSFVFDSMGVRWAKDIGATNYSSTGYFDESEGGKKWQFFTPRAEAHNTIVINPDGSQEQIYNAYAPITRFEYDTKGAIAVGDMTEMYSDDVTSAVRGVYFTDDRQSLVIRDELSLKAKSELYWFMVTDAAVEKVDDNTLILTQNGKKLKLELASAVVHDIGWDIIKPLYEEAITPNDVDYKNLRENRIQIKFPNVSGTVNITVKLTPYDINASSVSDYDMPIASWSITD